MHAKELPQGLWAELIGAVVYVFNRTGSTPFDNTPYEIWYSKKPRIGHLRIIGSICYAHIPKITKKQLDKKAVTGIFIGYDNDEGYRVWVKETNKLIRSRDVIFEEKTLNPSNFTKIPLRENQKIPESTPVIETENIPSTSEEIIEDLGNQTDHESVESDTELGEDNESESEEFLSEQEIEEQGRMTLRDRSILRPPDKFKDFVMNVVDDLRDVKEPQTYKDGIQSILKNGS